VKEIEAAKNVIGIGGGVAAKRRNRQRRGPAARNGDSASESEKLSNNEISA
jgi:hypothetical protein